jgi:hypothetical protein
VVETEYGSLYLRNLKFIRAVRTPVLEGAEVPGVSQPRLVRQQTVTNGVGGAGKQVVRELRSRNSAGAVSAGAGTLGERAPVSRSYAEATRGVVTRGQARRLGIKP